MSQKALFLTKAHGAWKVNNRTIPTPGPGELVVKIQSTALNPVDWKVQGEPTSPSRGACMLLGASGAFPLYISYL